MLGTFSWVEAVLSYEDEVSSSRTQHHTPGEIRICDLAIKNPTFYLAKGVPEGVIGNKEIHTWLWQYR